MAMIVASVLGGFVLLVLFKPIFRDGAGFRESIKYWLMPDIISLFRGQWTRDWISETKLMLWVIAGGLAGFAGHSGTIALLS